ncbi:methyl-accepting chemotaxis protein [Clostridium cylindrosporum]|uniref:Putative sensory transducer protein n=1 Tax=Clostridium cylindrosporum DSM 605 TaxID=1121307 RepID=A0A0J8D5C1_CLOCY|nr:methyl-accepting chemotaxis protein [Clostridium cylindrosporum]KMT21007.1 putative sensory transducer protein [Clostridium cylindrosporum DSM 605]
MNRFSNLKIKNKLILTFIVVITLVGSIILIAYSGINKMSELDNQLFYENVKPIGDISEVTLSFQKQRVNTRQMILSETQEERQSQYNQIIQERKKIKVAMERYINTNPTQEEKDNYEEYLNVDKEYLSITDKVLKLCLEGKIDEVKPYMRDGSILVQLASKEQAILEKAIEMSMKNAKEKANNNTLVGKSTVKNMLITMTIIDILAIAIAIFLSRKITQPLNEVVEAANKVAKGDLNVTLEAKSNDEIGMLSKSISTMIENLKVFVKDSYTTSQQVAEGSRQIADSSTVLSEGAIEQASSIEELNTSLTDIAKQTKQNAKSAGSAKEMSIVVKESAVKGNELMHDMLEAMQEINKASEDISKIIKVIDDIAFQTNILALNAAVEAARAGQHGKGFAVVAEEVRNLAARSAEAAKETTLKIEDSIKKAENGKNIANETAEALDNIVKGIEKTASSVEEIAKSSTEEAVAIDQINKGIEQLSQVVQRNSAAAQEGAASSEELYAQAEILKEMVGKLTLDEVSESSDGIKTSSIEKSSVNKSHEKPQIILSDRDYGKY